jgi:serine/threonine protein phosphatase PrpC
LIICVFDGHGGDKLADYCSNHIIEIMENYLKENKIKYKESETDKLIS